MDRHEWLEMRRKGIGSSDAAAICGLSPWRTPLHVYADKLGLLPETQSPAMDWGLRLEPAIAEAYREATGQILVAPPTICHPQYPWMLASADRTRLDRIVELKTSRSGEGWGDEGTDEIPEQYILQVQHQMAVTGFDLADVAVLIAGSDFRIYTVRANPALRERLIAIEERFWRRVEERRPPEPDWSDPETPKLLDLLNPPKAEKVIELSDQLTWHVDQYVDMGQSIRDFERFRAESKAHLLRSMGDAGIGRLPDGREVVRREVTRKGYEVKETTFTTFNIRKGKNEQYNGTERAVEHPSGTSGSEQIATCHRASETLDSGSHDPRSDHGRAANTGAA